MQASLNHQWALYSRLCKDSRTPHSLEVAFTAWLSFLAACRQALAGMMNHKPGQVFKVVSVLASWSSPHSHCTEQVHERFCPAPMGMAAWHPVFHPETQPQIILLCSSGTSSSSTIHPHLLLLYSLFITEKVIKVYFPTVQQYA